MPNHSVIDDRNQRDQRTSLLAQRVHEVRFEPGLERAPKHGSDAGNVGRRFWPDVVDHWRSGIYIDTLVKVPDRRPSHGDQQKRTQPSAKGPEDWFTGLVRIDSRFQRDAPARVAGATVTFEPGARTAWHTHPLGQTLIVISGFGLAQRDGGPIEELRPGDIVWFAPGEKHWHGASPTTAMSHIAIQEMLDGKAVDWMEKVTDQRYSSR